MGKIQSIDDLIGLLLRRQLLIGAITVFGIVISLLYASTKPDVFESTAVIQVQAPTVTGTEEATTTPRESSAQRLQAIEQLLTTRENLLAVIERHELYTGLPLTDDQKVSLLRSTLRFEKVASAASANFGQPAEISALLITAQAATRAKAARVANDFAQSILDAGANSQIDRAREALNFFQQEMERLKVLVDAAQAKLTAFTSENSDALPAQRDVLRLELTALETDLRTVDQSLVAARNDQASIERKTNLRVTDRRQLDSLRAQIDTLSAQGGALESRRAEILAIMSKAQTVDQTTDNLRRELTQLQTQYDIVARRSADAATDTKLQDNQQGESFTLLERGREPDYSISGGRKKLAIMGAIASLGLGLIVAFIADHIRPVLRTRAQLERELDLRPIVAIPEFSAKNWRQHRFMRDMPKLSDLTLGLQQGIAKGKSATKGSAGMPLLSQLGNMHLFLGGATVALLVIIAAILT